MMRSIDLSDDKVWVPRVITEAMPGDRRKNAARQHVGSDQRANGELAVEDEKDADNDQQQAGDLLGSVGARSAPATTRNGHPRRTAPWPRPNVPTPSACGLRRRSHGRFPGRTAIRRERRDGPRISPAVASWRDRADAASSSPTTIMIGSMASGIHASGPAMTNRTPTKSTAKIRSVADTTLPEVKNSRTESKSRS